MLKYTLSLLFTTATLSCFAQWNCFSDVLHRKRLAENMDYAARVAAVRADWSRHLAAGAYDKKVISGTDTIYEIPTVVHIVHTGGAAGTEFNPTDAEIIHAIDMLNGVWSASWAGYLDTAHGGVRMPFRFVLAKRDMNCDPSTGITRNDGSILPGYVDYGICPFGTVAGPSDAAVKSLNLWPVSDFYNIWIVNDIENGSAAGYAPWPWFTDAAILDGAVIVASQVRTSGSLFNLTIPHEVGHNFGLYHTFQDGCPNSSCSTQGDEICDTEPNEFTGFDCAEGTVNSCTGVTYAGVEHNVMNYTECPNRFTKGQRERVLFTQKTYRMGLANSLGSVAPDPSFTPPATACTPGTDFPDDTRDAGPRRIELADMVTQSGGYVGDGNKAYVDRSCVQAAAVLKAGNTYTISVGSGPTVEYAKAWIDYNNDGVFTAAEIILSHNGTVVSETHSAGFTVPASAVVMNRPLRMRVKADQGVAGAVDPCADMQYGQTEDYSVIIIPVPTSVPEVSTEAIRIYPNPVHDILQLDRAAATDVTVFSMDGRQLLQQRSATAADLSMLADGLYMIRLSDSRTGLVLQHSKILKQQ